MIRLIFPVFAFALVCLVFAGDAFGCSCTRYPTISRQLEDVYTKVVVTGRIESVHKIREEGEFPAGAYRSATLLVEKAYAGNVKAGDRLLLAQGHNASCGFTWTDESVGKRWLFYLPEPSTGPFSVAFEGDEQLAERDKPLMYRATYCSRSTLANLAARDIAYLNKMAKLKGKTRVSGDLGFRGQEDRSVEGVEVRLTGKDTKLKTKYVKGGYFEFYDVPPGDYLFEVVPPFGWRAVDGVRYNQQQSSEFDHATLAKLKKNQRYIRVAPGKHTDVDLGLLPDTQVSGRILSPTGTPMPNVCLSLEGAEEPPKIKDWRYDWRSRKCSDEKGEFKFETMQPGIYYLIVNPEGMIDHEQPFGKFYYPGAQSREMAAAIPVEVGKYADGIDVQVDQTTRLIEVSGRVLYADDKPGEYVLVQFQPTDAAVFKMISTGIRDGRFQMKIPFGVAGTLQGSASFYEVSHSECPKIMEFVKSSGSSAVKTTALEITGTEPSITTTLRLPFDFCENAKK